MATESLLGVAILVGLDGYRRVGIPTMPHQATPCQSAFALAPLLLYTYSPDSEDLVVDGPGTSLTSKLVARGLSCGCPICVSFYSFLFIPMAIPKHCRARAGHPPSLHWGGCFARRELMVCCYL